MKRISKILAGALAIGMIASASAQTIVLTGSTAFRAFTHNAIRAVLDSEEFAYSGTSLSSASFAIFRGNLGVGGPVVTIKTSWSGSITGIINVRNSSNVNVLPDNTAVSTGGTASAPTNALVTAVPDIALSDVSHTSTPFSDASLEEVKVGVIPFIFVASKDVPADVTNLTTQQSRQLWGNGSLPVAMLTGDPADQTNTAFAIGRNAGSGTRFLTFAETGIGVNSPVQQYRATVSGNDVTSHVLYPAESVDGIFYPEGNSGYESGGELRGIFRLNTQAGIGGFYITLLGVSDANGVSAPTGTGAGPGKQLSYNGIAYSEVALEQGQYTLWSYQVLVNRAPVAPGSLLGQFIAAVVPQIQSQDQIFADLQVDRTNDGSTVFPIY